MCVTSTLTSTTRLIVSTSWLREQPSPTYIEAAIVVTAGLMLRASQESVGSVANVEKIAHYVTVTIYGERFSFGYFAQKDADRSLFGVRVLPFSVGIGNAGDGIIESMRAVKQAQIFFDRELGDTVRANRLSGMIFFDWNRLRNTIYGSTR